MREYAADRDRFTPASIGDRLCGLRPSIKAVVDLVDTTDPAWPAVAAILQEFTAAGIDLDETSVTMAVKLGKRRWGTEEPSLQHEQATLASTGSIVYYIRRGELIKIGTTIAPQSRFADLLPDEILAIEPGGRHEEAIRHRQFLHLCSRGEYFHDAPELRDHIERMRSLHGDPDSSWPTTASLSRQQRRPWQPTLACSVEAMTAADAAGELGIKENTIRTWANRGRLRLAGRDERGRCLYYVEHMIALRDSARNRMSATSLVKRQ